MKIYNNSKSFSNVGTVVFYKHHKFFPSDPSEFDIIEGTSDDYKAVSVKYHGSRDNFPGIDFAEYDFSYIIDKYKFKNRLLLTELDSVSSELVGRNIDETDKIGKILFPTLVNEETNNPYDFFGSLTINNDNIYFLECLENLMTIEIYEDIIDSNVPGSNEFIEYEYLRLQGNTPNLIKPAVIIVLGPQRECYNNPTDLYFSNDPIKDLDNRNYELRYNNMDYSKICDEITSRKVVCLFLSTISTGDVETINVSFAAWRNNLNPARNKWKYDLRNDEFYSFPNNTGIINKTELGWEDRKSNTILGNSTIDSSLCPIKNKKISKLQRLQQDYYSPYRKYYKGENTIYRILNEDDNNQTVSYTTYNLESLVDGNIGNDPLLSPAWMLKDKFLDFLTNIIYISANPANTGSVINPGYQVTVKPSSDITFLITDGLGYKFSRRVFIIDRDDNIIDLVEGIDYTYSVTETDTEYLQKVNINSWIDFIEPESARYTNNLKFNFERRPSTFKILARKNGRIYHYSEWVSEFGQDGFGVSNIKLDGSPIPSSQISYSGGDMNVIIFNPEQRQSLELDFSGTLLKTEITSNYRLGNHKDTITIPIDNDVASTAVNFADAEFIVELDNVEKKLSVRSNTQLVIPGITGMSTVVYGSTHTIDFRLLSQTVQLSDINCYVKVSNFHYVGTREGGDRSRSSIMQIDSSIEIDSVGSYHLPGVNINLTRTNNVYYLELSNITENTLVEFFYRGII